MKKDWSFKPYYKWNTFNTHKSIKFYISISIVLNLIINGIPSIHKKDIGCKKVEGVLNLIINGIPSIPLRGTIENLDVLSVVLNLIINGIPSIRAITSSGGLYTLGVLNLIINGIPSIQ